MTDQKLPAQDNLVKSERATQTVPNIMYVINGNGELIHHSSTNGDLIFIGTASPGQTLRIAAQWADAVSRPAQVGSDGYFVAFVRDQPESFYVYTAKTDDGEVSRDLQVAIEVPHSINILWITGPDGKIIEQDEVTSHTSLRLEGITSTHYGPLSFEILDNGVVVQEVKDQFGQWSALVENLPAGSHEFTVRDEKGKVSASWKILIKE